LYMNLRMAKGRSPVVHQQMGEALKATVGSYLADVLASKPLGITVQIDEGHEVFDGKHSTLHPLFNKA
jgi:5-carboxymethyl-2-hydroxymuconate isomerase